MENEIKPSKILINTMSAFMGTRLDDDIKTGAFIPASEKENLEEEREFLAGLELPDCYFWALHPLDSVKLDGMLREGKQKMLDALTWSIEHANENAVSRISRTGTVAPWRMSRLNRRGTAARWINKDIDLFSSLIRRRQL